MYKRQGKNWEKVAGKENRVKVLDGYKGNTHMSGWNTGNNWILDVYKRQPYIHGFSWYQALAHHQLPVHLENDANCVGLSELLAHPEFENAACVVIGTGIGGAMIINGKIHRGRHGLGGEFGYMTTIEPAEKLNNWSQLASTGNMVRYVIEKSGQSDWDGRKVYQEASAGNALCQEAIERMNRNLAQGLLNIQYLIDPDVISLGGSISQNPEFIKGVQKAVDVFVERYEEYTIAPVIQACTYQADANLYGALAVSYTHLFGNQLRVKSRVLALSNS